MVDFYSDFTQLKYVFAEVTSKILIEDKNEDLSVDRDQVKNPLDEKIRILEDEMNIIEDSNLKFKEENDYLKIKINDLDNKILNLDNKILSQKKTISQFEIDAEELEFLRLNLSYGHKCRKSFFNSKGFKVGTMEYKNCVLNRGKID